MKKLLLLFLCLFMACSEPFDFESKHENQIVKEIKIEYVESFKETFGTNGVCYIDPTHHWGFTTTHTRGSNPNSNEWSNYVDVPSTITNDEAQYVYEFFRKYSKYDVPNVNIIWSDYFVQHVWKGTDSYETAVSGQYEVGGNHMDHLVVKDEHVYNFNAAYGSIMFMQDSETTKFGYRNSLDSQVHYDYKIMYIEGYGYYVGFDFEATGNNSNQKVTRDGDYTDWIVKISPANYINAVRIMAEDLGSTDDFDFNDVVFDVAFKQEWYPKQGIFAIITLQAAGGTLPLYILNEEVHELFGVPLKTMVNTGLVQRPIVIFRKQVQSMDAYDITIEVNNTHLAVRYPIEAFEGEVPFKICVPNYVDWAKERQNINEAYPKFNQWVAIESFPFWE